uniref:Uncharacterized protein n=1 Tax=Compsopogon caeruleus TaxID=31354 RepID=A0A7S1TA92_9RHOD|mmetsp:Transcript_13725/g.28178  ORF Transcript_13725/g.28178 Transcript_13725/m.28178 type:complete len:105 (+) Transcript_13725:26-340(+)
MRKTPLVNPLGNGLIPTTVIEMMPHRYDIVSMTEWSRHILLDHHHLIHGRINNESSNIWGHTHWFVLYSHPNSEIECLRSVGDDKEGRLGGVLRVGFQFVCLFS